MGLVSPWYHVEEPYGRVWGKEPRYFIVSNNTGLDFELDIALGYSWVGHPTYAGGMRHDTSEVPSDFQR